MKSTEKRRPRRIALWTGLVTKPRGERAERKGARVVRWIGARSRRKHNEREEAKAPSKDGDTVVVLKWSDTFGRSERPSPFERLAVAPVIVFPGLIAAHPASL